MPQNIEIKAASSDFEEQRRIAEHISETPVEILRQDDTFFDVPRGRLKLRQFDRAHGELISYSRPDKKEAAQSTYRIYPTDSPAELQAALGAALGIVGVVKKTRMLYRFGQLRIHFDRVSGLGDYIEFEYVLRPDEAPENGRRLINELKNTLNICEDDLISHAYIDLLLSDR
jgi:predicted adenylyl cyclase CyaB